MTGSGRTNSHTMELPRLITVGEKNIGDIGGFVAMLGRPRKISLVSGANVRRVVRDDIEDALDRKGIRYAWHAAGANEPESIARLQRLVQKDSSAMIAGVGGGRAVDAAKTIAHNLKRPFISVPTAASHDGIASPFVSIKGKKPHSIIATAPLGVFVDIDIIKRAPARLLAAGCGDLVANIIAVHDWRLGRDRTGEYYGRYAADLALMSAKIVMEDSARRGPDPRVIVEALISAGVAACIAGSSRPCSGAEHLFSHALDRLAPGVGLHGEKCGLGSIMMAKLQGQDWRRIAKTLRRVGAPVTAEELGLKSKDIVDALCMAQDLRPERYTILKEKIMTPDKARSLAKSTGVL